MPFPLLLEILQHPLPAEVLATLLLFFTGIWTGLQNALAGGGSFITLPVLLGLGLNPLAANITSTVALYPGQLASGFLGHRETRTLRQRHRGWVLLLNLIGGAVGGWLLMVTPSRIFEKMLPWLVLSATGIFALGCLRRPRSEPSKGSQAGALVVHFAIAIYGGYFGGGIGFLMLAALSLSGMGARESANLKNLLVAVINTSAVAVLMFSPELDLSHSLSLGTGALIGFVMGSRLLGRLNERWLRAGVVVIGLSLTIGLFVRGS